MNRLFIINKCLFQNIFSIIFMLSLLIFTLSCSTNPTRDSIPVTQTINFEGYEGLKVGNWVSIGEFHEYYKSGKNLGPSEGNLVHSIPTILTKRIENPLPNIDYEVTSNFKAGLYSAFSDIGTANIGVFNIETIDTSIDESYLITIEGGLINIADQMRESLDIIKFNRWKQRLLRWESQDIRLIAEVLYIENATFTVSFDKSIGLDLQVKLSDKLNAEISALNSNNKQLTFSYTNPIPIGYKFFNSSKLGIEIYGTDPVAPITIEAISDKTSLNTIGHRRIAGNISLDGDKNNRFVLLFIAIAIDGDNDFSNISAYFLEAFVDNEWVKLNTQNTIQQVLINSGELEYAQSGNFTHDIHLYDSKIEPGSVIKGTIFARTEIDLEKLKLVTKYRLRTVGYDNQIYYSEFNFTFN